MNYEPYLWIWLATSWGSTLSLPSKDRVAKRLAMESADMLRGFETWN